MADINQSTGKTYSIWMEDDVVATLDKEAGIQGTSKSKIVRAALMRYVDEMTIERDYSAAMKDVRGRKYD